MSSSADAPFDGLKRKVLCASVSAGILSVIGAIVQYYIQLTFVNGVLDKLQGSLPASALEDVPDWEVSGNIFVLILQIGFALLLPGLGYFAAQKEDKNMALGFSLCSCWNCCGACLATIIMLLIFLIMGFVINLMHDCDATVHCPLKDDSTSIAGLLFDDKAVDCLIKSQYPDYERAFPDWGKPMPTSCPNSLFFNCTSGVPNPSSGSSLGSAVGLLDLKDAAHHRANTAAWIAFINDLQHPHARALAHVASSFTNGLASLGTRLGGFPGNDPAPSPGVSLVAAQQDNPDGIPDDPLNTCGADEVLYLAWSSANQAVTFTWNRLEIFIISTMILGFASMVLGCLGVYWGYQFRGAITAGAYAVQTAPLLEKLSMQPDA